MSLSNKQLILLDTLAYYSAFSDINALPSGKTVADIIGYIENKTCPHRTDRLIFLIYFNS